METMPERRQRAVQAVRCVLSSPSIPALPTNSFESSTCRSSTDAECAFQPPMRLPCSSRMCTWPACVPMAWGCGESARRDCCAKHGHDSPRHGQRQPWRWHCPSAAPPLRRSSGASTSDAALPRPLLTRCLLPPRRLRARPARDPAALPALSFRHPSLQNLDLVARRRCRLCQWHCRRLRATPGPRPPSRAGHARAPAPRTLQCAVRAHGGQSSRCSRPRPAAAACPSARRSQTRHHRRPRPRARRARRRRG